jgi:hypothetical protein
MWEIMYKIKFENNHEVPALCKIRVFRNAGREESSLSNEYMWKETPKQNTAVWSPCRGTNNYSSSGGIVIGFEKGKVWTFVFGNDPDCLIIRRKDEGTEGSMVASWIRPCGPVLVDMKNTMAKNKKIKWRKESEKLQVTVEMSLHVTKTAMDYVRELQYLNTSWRGARWSSMTLSPPHPVLRARFWLRICRFPGTPPLPSCTCASLAAWKQMAENNLTGQRLHFSVREWW